MLNAIMTLSNGFNLGPKSLHYNYHYQYMMGVDIPSIYNSNNLQREITYNEDLITNTPDGMWKKVVFRMLSNGEKIIIDARQVDGSKIFDKEQNTLNFSLDLGSVGFPNNYVLHLQAYIDIYDKEGIKQCSLMDSTNGFLIPIPQYSISVFPNSIELIPGDPKTILLKVSTNVPTRNSMTNLSSQYNSSLMDINFSPSHLSIPPLGSNTSIITIKAKDIPKQLLPIMQTPIINATSIAFANIYSGKYRLEGNSLNNEISNSFSNLTITISKPLTLGQKFVIFWTNYGSFISFIGGGFAAGFSALIFQKFFKRNENRKDIT